MAHINARDAKRYGLRQWLCRDVLFRAVMGVASGMWSFASSRQCCADSPRIGTLLTWEIVLCVAYATVSPTNGASYSSGHPPELTDLDNQWSMLAVLRATSLPLSCPSPCKCHSLPLCASSTDDLAPERYMEWDTLSILETGRTPLSHSVLSLWISVCLPSPITPTRL